MKKIFLVLVASAFALLLSAQGTLRLTAGATIKSSGDAYLVLNDMHLVNDGSVQQSANNGHVKLTGNMNTSLSGSGATSINKLLLEKPGPATTFNIQSDISVVSKVNFSGGLLNLNNSILYLGTTGEFTSESELSRAYTIGSGYIEITKMLNNPSADNVGNLGAMISSTANMGTTIIRRGHAIQTGVSGTNNSIRRYFDIMPMNNLNLKAVLRFSYFDAELNGIPEATLHQWKSKDNINWDFVGADARDISVNYVEKKSINKFERTTLATATAPGITCPANQTVSANTNGCKASVSFAATATGIPTPSIIYKIGNTVISSPYVFSKGTTTVTATASNGILPDASCTFTVTVNCGSSNAPVTRSSQEIVVTGGLSVSARPNPSAGYFTLDIKSGDQNPVNIKIIDVLGRVISNQTNLASNSILNVGHQYLPGVYFVQAIQGKQVVLLKLVKQR